MNTSTFGEGGTPPTPQGQKLLHSGPFWPSLYVTLHLAVHLYLLIYPL